MTDPVKILVKRDELTLEGIKQFFVAVEKEEWKFRRIRDRDSQHVVLKNGFPREKHLSVFW